ncbi:MAG: hypothetical protein LBG13_01555, partial [Holosporales bacterium]|nr:hypothetical protein [Holosporales bacterium]
TAVSDEELECVESVLKGVTHLLEVRQAIRDGRCIKFQPDAAAWKACDILLKIFPGLKGLPKALFDPRSEEKFYGMAVLDLLLGIEILKQAKDKKVTIDNYKSVAAWVNKEISNETKLKEEMLSEKVE